MRSLDIGADEGCEAAADVETERAELGQVILVTGAHIAYTHTCVALCMCVLTELGQVTRTHTHRHTRARATRMVSMLLVRNNIIGLKFMMAGSDSNPFFCWSDPVTEQIKEHEGVAARWATPGTVHVW